MSKTFHSKHLLLALSLLVLAPLSIIGQSPYSDPDNTGNWNLVSYLSDEFDGTTLNTNKWYVKGTGGDYYFSVGSGDTQIQNWWKGRAPSMFSPNNVKVENGQLVLTSKWEPTFSFSGSENGGNGEDILYGGTDGNMPVTTACVVAKNTLLYGYMEIKAKAAKGPISSSFWTTGKDGEIDIFEHWGRNPSADKKSAQRMHTSFHDWRSGSGTYGTRIWDNEHYMDWDVSDDYHTYGLEWNANYIKIYLDGQLIRTSTKSEMGNDWVAYNPQVMWIDMELFEWEEDVYDDNGNPNYTSSDFSGGLEYKVEYVRVWQSSSSGDSNDDRPNLMGNASFESGTTSWNLSGGATVVSNNAQDGSKSMYLNGASTAYQYIAVEPNTTYMASFWVKTPGTNMTNIWHNAWVSVKEFNASNTKTAEEYVKYYEPDYTRKAIQMTTGSDATGLTIEFTNTWDGNNPAYADNFKLIKLVETVGSGEIVTGGNLLGNGDFESGSTGWTLEGDASIGTSNPNNGSYAGYIDGNGSVNQTILLEANTTYTLSAYGKVAATGQNLIIGVTNADTDAFVSSKTFTSTSYAQQTFTFTTDASAQSYKIWIWSDGGGSYYIDDAELLGPGEGEEGEDPENEDPDSNESSSSMLENADFELGNQGWTLEDGASIETTNTNNSSSYAGQIASNGSINQTILLEANTTYTVSAYGKVSTSGESFFMGITNVDSSKFISNQPFTSTDYTEKSITFTTGATANNFKIWFWNNAGGTYYIDDIEMLDPNYVEEEPEVELLPNSDFELGNQDWTLDDAASIVTTNTNNGSSYAGYIDGNGSINQTVLLKANTTYTVSCYGKVASNGQSVFLGITNTDEGQFISNTLFEQTSYEKRSIEFTTGSSDQNYKIWFWNSAGGEYYVDDFELQEGTVTNASSTSIKEVNIYPNPAADQFNVSAQKAETIEIYNAMGTLVKKLNKVSEPQLVATEDLIPGMYILNITFESHSHISKIQIK